MRYKSNQNRTKRQYERAVKRSISMPEILHQRAQDKSRDRGFSTFSDYIQDLIRRDTTQFAA